MNAYLDILTSNSLAEAVQRALAQFVRLVNPIAVCLLLWDIELDRYIVGDTIINDSQILPADFRRIALRAAENPSNLPLMSSVQILPIDDYRGKRVAILFYQGGVTLGADESQLFERCVSKALYSNFRLEIAEREHQQLQADTKRLEQLLQAVEQQQHTINKLLAKEREWSAELERRVDENVKALKDAQKRLSQFEKLALIGQLASSLAHELNNPLQAIQSGVGLVITDLQSGYLDQVEADLRVIESELERIQTILRQMLDFYRPSQTECISLDVNTICRDTSNLMCKQLQNSNVKLTLNLSAEMPSIQGDRHQIKQILINLILNATEAMDNVGGIINLQTASNSSHVVISVQDNGPGIQPEHLPKLFEPLFTTKTRGLGLGLAICQDIAQQHGGYIHVITQIGVGTTFALEIPIDRKG